MSDLERVAQHRHIIRTSRGQLDNERAEAIARLLDDGWTYRSLARELGVSPALVHQWRWPNGTPDKENKK